MSVAQAPPPTMLAAATPCHPAQAAYVRAPCDNNNAPSAAAQAQGSTPGSLSLRRTLCVHIHDTLANLEAQGPLAGMWKPTLGQEATVFSPDNFLERDPTQSIDALRNAVIKSVHVKEHWSTFPCPLGVSIAGVPGREMTALGQAFAYTVPPLTRSASPQQVYQAQPDKTDTLDWRTRFARWNKSNLETEGVTQFAGQPYVFVHLDHPAVEVLRYNEHDTGTCVDKMERFERDFIKVPKSTFLRCCEALRTQILDQHLTQNLALFNVQIHRLDAPAWDEYGDGSISLHGLQADPLWTEAQHDLAKENHLKRFVQTPYNYIARLEVEYEIPHSAGAVTALQ